MLHFIHFHDIVYFIVIVVSTSYGVEMIEINYWAENSSYSFQFIECMLFFLRFKIPKYSFIHHLFFLAFLTVELGSNLYLISLFCPPTFETHLDNLYVSLLQTETLRMSNFNSRGKNLSQVR